MLGFVFLCLFIAPLIPPLIALETITTTHQTLLLWISGITAFLGLLAMVGTITELNIRLGQVISDEEEIGGMIKDMKEQALPGVAYRKWAYKFRGKGAGSSIQIEIPFAELKAAFRTGEWISDPVLLRVVLIALSAGLMTVGIFGLVITLCPAGLKLVFIVAIGYAAVRTVHAWNRS